MTYQFLGYYFTDTQLFVASIVLAVVVLIAVGFLVQRRNAGRTLAFKRRFGSEYARAVLTHGSAHRAEAHLADREARVESLNLRELGATERERFLKEWETVQSRFLDHPKAAVLEASDLVDALLEIRGYPKAAFEQRAADLSVSYPRATDNYRNAHAIAVRSGRLEATTEELRTALIQYRAIFDDLLLVSKSGEIETAA
jgi:hypothetical protein